LRFTIFVWHVISLLYFAAAWQLWNNDDD